MNISIDDLDDLKIDREEFKKIVEYFTLYNSIQIEKSVERQIEELQWDRIAFRKKEITEEIQLSYYQGTISKDIYRKLNNKLQQRYDEMHDEWIQEVNTKYEQRYIEKMRGYGKI